MEGVFMPSGFLKTIQIDTDAFQIVDVNNDGIFGIHSFPYGYDK